MLTLIVLNRTKPNCTIFIVKKYKQLKNKKKLKKEGMTSNIAVNSTLSFCNLCLCQRFLLKSISQSSTPIRSHHWVSPWIDSKRIGEWQRWGCGENWVPFDRFFSFKSLFSTYKKEFYQIIFFINFDKNSKFF